MKRKRLPVPQYLAGIASSSAVVLSQAITIIESNKPEDQVLASEIMQQLSTIKKENTALRIGITGVPGVGKSTFIDTFGSFLTHQGLKIAILSIDPSSQKTKGSILGDKTRMENLARDKNAYIRPSPSGTTLGGVAHKTHETILLCEAAGFDCVIVETVGVGQSETMVKDMVDFFLLLMLPGGGDELQGVKRGIMEMADAIAINKSDGDQIKTARKAKVNYQNAMHLFPPNLNGWVPPVLLCSAIEKTGITEIWESIKKFEGKMIQNKFLESNRQSQNEIWFEQLLQYKLMEKLYKAPELHTKITETKKSFFQDKINVPTAVNKILKEWQHFDIKKGS